MADDVPIDLKEYAANIVASFVSANKIAAGDLPKLINGIYWALQDLQGNPDETSEPPTPKLTAAQIRRTIKPHAIQCLECGGSFKTLRRHLGSTHSLTPHQYRDKYALPADYPLVSEATSKVRSDYAKTNGLGRRAGRMVRKEARPAPSI